MKKVLVVCVVALLISFITKAQQNEQPRYLVSTIIVNAPDENDSIFIATAIREQLIKNNLIKIVPVFGDTLCVRLILEHTKSENAGINRGRDGKWGEITLIIYSKYGDAAVVSRGYLQSDDGSSYYNALKGVITSASKNFSFIQ